MAAAIPDHSIQTWKSTILTLLSEMEGVASKIEAFVLKMKGELTEEDLDLNCLDLLKREPTSSLYKLCALEKRIYLYLVDVIQSAKRLGDENSYVASVVGKINLTQAKVLSLKVDIERTKTSFLELKIRSLQTQRRRSIS